MLSVVRKLERRLAQAEGDRIGVLIDLALRHHERGNHVDAVSVALEAVEACADDPRRRSDAQRIIARSLLAAEAYDLAATVAARAIQDAVTAADPGREARARETQALLLLRRGHHADARREYRLAGLRHRLARDTLAMKRTAMHIGNTYRQQAIAAEASQRYQHAVVNLKQALRAYRIALVTGEFADDDAAIAAAAADCENRRGNFGLARIHIDRALVRAPRIENLAIVAEIHLVESALHRATGDLRAAEWAGERACSAARPFRDETLARGLLALAAVNDAQGRFERGSDLENQARDISIERQQVAARLRAELTTLWNAGTPATPVDAA